MTNKKYTWIWKDDESVHRNEADSLKEIIYEIVNYYFYSGSDAGGIVIEETNNTLNVKFTHEEGECYNHDVEAEPCEVATYLEELAQIEGRKDKFAIYEY